MRTLRTLAALCAAFAAVAACVPQLADLAPFPCANDETCPGGLSCTPGVGCVRASLDSPCRVGMTDCAPAGQGAVCELGLCTIPCDEQRPCASGHLCSAPPAAGSGVCVADCSRGDACPAGLSCHPLGYQGAKGCVGAADKVPLDGPCTTDDDCASAGSAVKCHAGVCATACGPNLPCDAAHLCSVYKAVSDGACIVDCTTTAQCPQGLECAPAGYEGKKACLGPGETLNACSDDLATDAKNCGACAHDCGALGTCSRGACSCSKTLCGSTCTDVMADGKNCGACGHDCLGGACSAGACQPIALGDVGDLGPNGNLARADATSAYLVRASALMGGVAKGYDVLKVPLAGGAPAVAASYALTNPDPNFNYSLGWALNASTLFLDYFNDQSSTSDWGIRSVDLATNKVTTITNQLGTQNAAALDILGGLFAEPTFVLAVGTNPANGELAVPFPTTPGAVSPQAIYLPYGGSFAFVQPVLYVLQSDATGKQINVYRVDITVTHVEEEPPTVPRYNGDFIKGLGNPVFTKALTDPHAIEADGSIVYLAVGDSVLRVDTTSGMDTSLASGIALLSSFASDAKHVYWLDRGHGPLYDDGAIRRVPKAGGAVETLVPLNTPGSNFPFMVLGTDSVVYRVGTKLYRLAK